ncbi:hypothetical protein SE17_18070, partial [Kouleothrix aurantiaca]
GIVLMGSSCIFWLSYSTMMPQSFLNFLLDAHGAGAARAPAALRPEQTALKHALLRCKNSGPAA